MAVKKKRRGRPPKAKHLDNFLSNVAEVGRLMEIHAGVAGASTGRKYKVEVLNKSGIVLLVACWEAFVEDLAEAAFELMLRKSKTPDVFSGKVLTMASKGLKEANDARKVWELAGDGWKTVLQRHKQATLERYVGKLNTPKPDQIDEIFTSLLGLKLSSHWKWHKMKPVKSRTQLEKLVKLRGSIAHRVSTATAVRKAHVVKQERFVTRLAITSHNAVNSHLLKSLGYKPWDDRVYTPPS